MHIFKWIIDSVNNGYVLIGIVRIVTVALRVSLNVERDNVSCLERSTLKFGGLETAVVVW